MKALLTSNGISNRSIEHALIDLLGKPIAESDALFIPTAIYPFPGSPTMAWRAVNGQAASPLCQLGWKSLGILELSVLPSVEREAWLPPVQAADAFLVWGGDPLFLAEWFRRSGLAELLPELLNRAVYVGVSAGSMAATRTIVETYTEPPHGQYGPLSTQDVVFDGGVDRILVTGAGVGLVDFSIIPHVNHPQHADASSANAERWASNIPASTYAIDDESAIKVVDSSVEVISEGEWRLFEPRT